MRRARPVHLLSRRRPTQNCVWPITIQHPEFPMLLDIIRDHAPAGYFKRGVELNYDDWANAKANNGSLAGDGQFPHSKSGTSVHGYWAPLYCATPSVVGMMRCWPNGKQWHAEHQRGTTLVRGNHPFRLATAAFSLRMRLKSPDRAGIHLNQHRGGLISDPLD